MKKLFLILCCICLPIYALETISLNNAKIPPDIPPAIIHFVSEKRKNPDDYKILIKYLTIWKNKYEVYIYSIDNIHSSYYTFPQMVLYDCKEARYPTLEELYDIKFFMINYKNINMKPEHLCHRNLEAFNQHNIPNPYKKRVKYYTPKYIPKPVVKYINEQYPVSWHPGLTKRYIKYLTTYNDKYEIYFVYWKDSKSDFHNFGKYILYDCQNVREPQDRIEKMKLMNILPNEKYASTNKPNFCTSK